MFSSLSWFFKRSEPEPDENIVDDFLMVDKNDFSFDTESEDGEWTVILKDQSKGSGGKSQEVSNSDISLKCTLPEVPLDNFHVPTPILDSPPHNKSKTESVIREIMALVGSSRAVVSGTKKKSNKLTHKSQPGAFAYDRHYIAKLKEWRPIRCNKKSLKRSYKAMMYASGQRKR